MADERRFRGVYKKPTKVPTWGAAITVDRHKYYLGTWRDPEDAARAYDWMAIQHFGDRATLNFPEYRAYARQRAPGNIRFATMAQEREHRQAEQQLALKRRQEQEDDSLLEALRRDPQVMAAQFAWFGGQQHGQGAGPSVARQQPDPEAGPSGASQQNGQEEDWFSDEFGDSEDSGGSDDSFYGGVD